MSDLTNYAENKLIDLLMRAVDPGLPSSWYIGLLTAITDAEVGTVTEVSGGSYARVATVRSLTSWCGTQAAGSTTSSNGTSGVSSNNAALTFPAPTADWGTIVGVGLYSASTGGTPWAVHVLVNSVGATITRAVLSGDAAPFFDVAALRFALD
jgi:hypothetical protein